MNNRPIGVFDSGVGGLSCVSGLSRMFPEEDIVYFGDTARIPYGSKDAELVRAYANQIADFLVSRNVKMLIIACNTISALCAEELRRRYPHIPIIEIIGPTASYVAAQQNRQGNTGIIATKATVKSGMYERLLSQGGVGSPIFSLACPLFVPVIENGFFEGNIVESIVRYYMDSFIQSNSIGTLILGCTHYPFIKTSIQKLYPEVEIINPSEIILHEVSDVLRQRDSKAEQGRKGRRAYFASELSETFLTLVRQIEGEERTVEIGLKTF